MNLKKTKTTSLFTEKFQVQYQTQQQKIVPHVRCNFGVKEGAYFKYWHILHTLLLSYVHRWNRGHSHAQTSYLALLYRET